MEKALEMLTWEFGPKAKKEAGGLQWVVSGSGLKRAVFSARLEELERDDAVLPLEPTAPQLRQLAEGLWRTGERLPLVIISHQRGAFRNSVALWVGNGVTVPVEMLKELEKLVEGWNGVDSQDLVAFADRLNEGQKKARQAFKELDAAFQDPRWQAGMLQS